MKKSTAKHSVLSRERIVHFNKALKIATAGKKESVERGMVINARECKQKGGWPGWEPIYKNELFKRMVDLDASFFRRIAEAIDYVEGGGSDDNPQAAAIMKGWLVWTNRHNKFPTVRELSEFVHANSKAVKNWSVSDPYYHQTVRDICKRRRLNFSAGKPGRKRK